MKSKKIVCLILSLSFLTKAPLMAFGLADIKDLNSKVMSYIKNKTSNLTEKTKENFGTFTQKVKNITAQDVKKNAPYIIAAASALAIVPALGTLLYNSIFKKSDALEIDVTDVNKGIIDDLITDIDVSLEESPKGSSKKLIITSSAGIVTIVAALIYALKSYFSEKTPEESNPDNTTEPEKAETVKEEVETKKPVAEEKAETSEEVETKKPVAEEKAETVKEEVETKEPVAKEKAETVKEEVETKKPVAEEKAETVKEEVETKKPVAEEKAETVKEEVETKKPVAEEKAETVKEEVETKEPVAEEKAETVKEEVETKKPVAEEKAETVKEEVETKEPVAEEKAETVKEEVETKEPVAKEKAETSEEESYDEYTDSDDEEESKESNSFFDKKNPETRKRLQAIKAEENKQNEAEKAEKNTKELGNEANGITFETDSEGEESEGEEIKQTFKKREPNLKTVDIKKTHEKLRRKIEAMEPQSTSKSDKEKRMIENESNERKPTTTKHHRDLNSTEIITDDILEMLKEKESKLPENIKETLEIQNL